MPSSASTQPFRDLAAALIAGGFASHGRRIEEVLDGVWTTSTELLGELGAAVLCVRRECKPLSAAQKALIAECLRQVRIAWPGFGFFR